MLSLHELVQDGCSLVQFLFSASVSAIAVLEPTYWRWQGSSIGDDQLLENGQGHLAYCFGLFIPCWLRHRQKEEQQKHWGKDQSLWQPHYGEGHRHGKWREGYEQSLGYWWRLGARAHQLLCLNFSVLVS